jgi:TRAP-type mannitol/chloroaromatic compound transport system permease small subunit
VTAVPGGRDTTRRLVVVLIVAILAGLAYVVITETFSTSGRIGLVAAGLIAIVALLAIIEPGSSVAGRILLGYQRTVDTLSEGLGWIAKWLVPTVVVVGFVNVLLRYIGRWQNRALTSNRYVELQWMLFGAIFLLVFPYVLKHGINVRVDFIYQRFSRKVQALIDFVGHLLSLVPYCLFAIWVVWDYALTSLFQRSPRWDTWRVWDVWEKSGNAGGLSPAPIKILLLLGFVFLLLQTVAELIKLGFVLGEKEQLAAPEIQEEPLRVE